MQKAIKSPEKPSIPNIMVKIQPKTFMIERNIKYSINLNFEEIKLPPFQDILIVGKNCSQGKIGLSKSFEMLVPNGFEILDITDERVETVFVNKHILKKMPVDKVLHILNQNVFPFVSEGELIRPFVNGNYTTVDAYNAVKQIKHKIIAHGGAVVLMDERPIGLITANDIITNNYNLVIDCLSEKPKVSPQDTVPQVLQMMQRSGSDTLADVAHDLRTPIANMMGIINILEDSLEGSDDQELISSAKAAYVNASNLINELLKPRQSTEQSDQGETIEIVSLLKECIADIQISVLNKSIEMEVLLPSEEIFSFGQAQTVRRAIDNILTNALKFTREHGKICIKASPEDGYCLVSISDNGIGIPDKFKPFLFQRYTTAKRAGTSGEQTTGMGLHITKNICEQYGIELDFKSTESEGTTFYLRFALADKGKITYI
eukprot:gene15785-19032_t